jgi:hypothetical protein
MNASHRHGGWLSIWRRLAMTVVLGTIAVPSLAGEMRCTFAARHSCDATGCKSIDPAQVYTVLDFSTARYGRCGDGKPCNWHAMKAVRDGAFVNINFAPGPQAAKMSLDGTTFVETVSALDVVIVSFGTCAH